MINRRRRRIRQSPFHTIVTHFPFCYHSRCSSAAYRATTTVAFLVWQDLRRLIRGRTLVQSGSLCSLRFVTPMVGQPSTWEYQLSTSLFNLLTSTFLSVASAISESKRGVRIDARVEATYSPYVTYRGAIRLIELATDALCVRKTDLTRRFGSPCVSKEDPWPRFFDNLSLLARVYPVRFMKRCCLFLSNYGW